MRITWVFGLSEVFCDDLYKTRDRNEFWKKERQRAQVHRMGILCREVEKVSSLLFSSPWLEALVRECRGLAEEGRRSLCRAGSTNSKRED